MEEGDDEEDLEEDNFPLVEAEVICTVKIAEELDHTVPKKTYVNFKYKGSKQVFARFTKQIMRDLKIFQGEGNVVKGI